MNISSASSITSTASTSVTAGIASNGTSLSSSSQVVTGSTMNRRNNNNNNNNNNSNLGNNDTNATNNNKSKKKKFYPKLIATQIIAIQCFHYLILTLLYEINAMIFTIDTSHITMSTGRTTSSISTTYMSLDRIFTDQYINLYRLSSYPDIITTFITAVCTAYVFVVIVEKSKQCLDFAITLFICHFLCVWMYNQQFPTHVEWYIVHTLSTIVMILLAEHLCVKRELDDIPLLTL